jgi:methionyl-tRNA formyltransferase
MFGTNNLICIAGKNKCSIDFVKYISSKIPKKQILILPNKTDKSKDSWQPSLRKYAKKNNYKIVRLEELYNIDELIFISIEYESIIKTKKFKSKKLYNFHFSLLPKYRGCHTNFFQILNGEKKSGVTLHEIDDGIDTGPIIDNIKFEIKKNTNAFMNYLILMRYSLKLLKKNFHKILKNNYKKRIQLLNKGSYFSRTSVNYKEINNFNINKINKNEFYKIKALIFYPFQLPVVNNKRIKDIKYKNRKYIISYD